MKDYLSELNESIPVRRTPEQHDAIFEYVRSEAEELGLNAEIELLENKHRNIVIGDVESADAVFTAHYDTPACSVIPNLMMPRNPVLGKVYILTISITLALLSLGIAYLIKHFVPQIGNAWVILYLALYFGAFFGLMRRGDNKNNYNDNTSGVAAVLSIMAKKPKNAAYILFDNEEKGLLGSKAYNKAHKDMMKDKLVINLDCVGNGDNIIVVAKPEAEKHGLYSVLKDNLVSNDEYSVYFFPQKGSSSNTDYKSFPTALSVMACKKKNKIFYTSKIHTVKDTEVNTENITFIAEGLSRAMGDNL